METSCGSADRQREDVRRQGDFDATHGNLLTGASSALSEESLAAAKTAMMKQKDIAGQIIRMVPRYLIVSPENEMMAKNW